MTIKLKVRTMERVKCGELGEVETEVVFIQNENPGFRVGDILRWDEDIVPLERQPRPLVGVVIDLWHNGCEIVRGTNSPPCEEPRCFTFEHLARVSVVDRPNQSPT